MEKLKLTMVTTEEGRENPVYVTEDNESVIQHTITALYDGAVKRCKLKIEQYYEEGKEYCRIKATYERYGVDFEKFKDTYIVEGWCNDWGNYINVFNTFKDNNIDIR